MDLEIRAAAEASEQAALPPAPPQKPHSRRDQILRKVREAERIEAARVAASIQQAQPKPKQPKRQKLKRQKPAKKPIRKPVWPIIAALAAARMAKMRESFRAVRQLILQSSRNTARILSASVRQIFMILARCQKAASGALSAIRADLMTLLIRVARPAMRASVVGGYAGLVGLSGYVLYAQAGDLPSRTEALVFAEAVASPVLPVWHKAVVRPVPVFLDEMAADEGTPEILSPVPVVVPVSRPVQVVAVPAIQKKPLPRIAIVIDDLGMDRRNTRRAINLPATVTLAFLPYAPNVRQQAARASAKGHELLVHLPMEPKHTTLDPGPLALMTGGNDRQLMARLDWNLTRFPGFVGVNNHMGSHFTEQTDDMRAVLNILQERGLYYLDSRTTPRSVGQTVAREIGMPHARRNVFLDNIRDKVAIRRQLMIAEHLASRRGQVIAIGHPYPETMAVLAEWAAALNGRGFELVPLSNLMTKPDAPVQVAAAAP